MWSGPRNISTALMRSFENRPDTTVVDEPFYAHYLRQTGLDHPGAHEVIQDQDPNWKNVVAALTGPVPDDQPIYYQKQMTHHLLPNIETAWLKNPEFTHVFLIRDPLEMITSLIKVLPRVNIQDTGVPQQARIFDLISSFTEQPPLVIDSKDVLENPRALLTKLCAKLNIPFTENMLNWPSGSRPTDGIWAQHWYANVNKSTAFAKYQSKNEPVPAELQPVADECLELYQNMYRIRLVA